MDFASVPYHILSPKDAKPIVQVVQDTMLGSYRITQPYTAIHDKAFANLQMVNSYFTGALPAPAHEHHHYSGRQAFSGILPPGLFLEAGNKQGGRVTIKNGELVAGPHAKDGLVDKDVYNAMSRGLIPVLFHDYGPFEVRRFMDNIQRLVCRWLLTGGFSVGISDLVVADKVNEELRKVAEGLKTDAYALLHKALRGQLDNTSMFNNHEFFEREISNVLNENIKKAGKIGLQTIDDRTNRLINMVKSGAKGKDLNVTQMVAALGQQMIDGKRVGYGFTDRTLPHYCKFDDGPEARGYVESSFIKGLTPAEMFFHAMGGREGLIDTAVKSVTGDTVVMVLEDGVPKTVRIGDWIDAHLAARAGSVEHYEARNLEMLYLDRVVHIPTVDADGNMTWGELIAVTRHDPGTALYKVTTEGGREVIVTESKSLLVWNGEQFIVKDTPKVVVGDFLPVTMTLPEPPVVVEYVDMAEYFPKDKYVHGTEYNKAVAAMREAQGDKFFIPKVKGSSWWEQNNGKTFTVPYPSKARLQRATVRSNNENIKDGCVYPFHASRESARIPARFELDYDNGVFIGIYLADGCSHVHSGTVSIAKEDVSVQRWVMGWFDKFAITHRIDRTVKERGVSTSVIGNSRLLAQFMDDFVGHGARNKYVPDVAFAAPLAFVRGVISGYFSGDGTIPRGGVTADSTSRRLIEGISMLCSRLGIFGKISTTQQKSNNLGTKDIAPMHHISIRAQWARKFEQEITLIMDCKNEALHTMNFTEKHCNFDEHHDVVLDAIKSIEVLGVEAYPKVYDVSVPSTLNFSLQNGLGCHDTSDTGYLQRRLVKAMEDAKIYYDNTVRNAAGSVIQFVYGEDGMEGTKVEKQTVPTVGRNVFELDREYHLRTTDNLELHLTPEAFEQMKKEDWQAACGAHFEQLMVDREVLVEQIQRGQKNDKVLYPIPFERILKTAVERMKAAHLDGLPADVTPGAILKAIKGLEDELYVTQPGQATFFLRMLIRIYLSPKPLIVRHHIKKEVFEWIVGEVRRYFKEAVAPAGEMVGIIAAQSIGEPATQLSCIKSTQLRLMTPKGPYTGTIGDFIDGLYDAHPDAAVYFDDKRDTELRSSAMDLTDDYYIIGVSGDEKTSWRRIKQVSRHPANGGMVKVTTRSGRTTTATLSHSFLKRTETTIVPIEGGKLAVGDRIPVARRIPEAAAPSGDADGYALGASLAATDRVPAWVFGKSTSFIKGVVDGLPLTASEGLIDDVCVLYAYLDIFAIKKKVGDDQWTVDIDEAAVAEVDCIPALGRVLAECGETVEGDVKRVDLLAKIAAIEAREGDSPALATLRQAANSDVVWDEIVALDYLPDPQEYVYDFTVPGNDSFMVDTCVLVHNTLDSFHVSGTAAAVKATSGVPRIKELMSVSKNIKTPTMLIHLKPDLGTVVGAEEDAEGLVTSDARVKEAKKRAMEVLRSLEITTIEDIIDSTEIYYDPAGEDGYGTAIAADAGFLETYRAFTALTGAPAGAGATSPWVLRIRVNKEKLHAAHITMTDLHLKLHAAYNAMVDIVFTDDNAEELVMRARLVDHPKDDAVAGLKALEQSLVNRLIKGVERISKVSMHPETTELYNPATQAFDKVTEWVLDTDGSNFIEILSNPNVDATRTISNDPREICAVLGIEAARASLHNEIMEVIRESSMNYRHVSLLVDTMTHRGTMMSIDRHGINRGDVGPLAKSSFEETTDMLVNASVFAEYDKINGVSANIMLGQLPPCGTGSSEILLDEDAYIAALRGLARKSGLASVPEAPEAEEPAEADPCALAGIHFHYKAPQRTDVGRTYELPAM